MATNVRTAIEAIWHAMDLAVPPETIGPRYEFAVDDTDVVVKLADNGQTVVVEAELGSLSTEPMQAGDQLRRLMRIGLGFAAFNRSTLSVPDGGNPVSLTALVTGRVEDRPKLRVFAVATIDGDPRRQSVSALQDVLQWRTYSDPILERTEGRDVFDILGASSARDDDAGFVIFQP